jgi:hypothetical protein
MKGEDVGPGVFVGKAFSDATFGHGERGADFLIIS